MYLPGSWTRDRERCQAAGVPDSDAFATKPQLGIAMLTGVEASSMPFSWVVADADYGEDPALRSWLHERRICYVLAVPVTLPLTGPPGKPSLPKVAAVGDLLHYATVCEKRSWSAAARARAPRDSAPTTGQLLRCAIGAQMYLKTRDSH
ncbi:hypothetical protein EJ357_30150 [Streptomyces cyaneochromogenes]|uniref:Transposase IS701-like DDE domain-containing protein n=1 Tax=Streptomyces cyaneochromogenes TaxID=2496836 RepID=A0A3S9MDD7_9ACTN|nr:hypothetical protein EJ357_30150 [Streptomyces cyaneochromogenes]